MCRLTVALCPVEIAELLEEIERVLIQTLDHRQSSYGSHFVYSTSYGSRS